jgi:hypothetical protein
MSSGLQAASNNLSGATQALIKQGAVVPLSSIAGVQIRQTPSSAVNAPLTVSVARALAAVCALQRITVYDLNDEEEEDEEEEEEEEAAAAHVDTGNGEMEVDE